MTKSEPMDGICGSQGRRLALAFVLALALLAPGHAAAAAATHAPIKTVLPSTTIPAGFSPIGATSGSSPLSNHGGAVMHTNKVYAIYWVPPGYTVSANYRSLIDGYFQNVAADSGKTTNVYATSAEYSDGGGPAAYSSTFGGSIVDTQAYPTSGCTNTNPQTGSPFATCLLDSQITTEIDRVAVAQGWPRNGTTMFFMFTARNVGTCFSGGTTCFAQYFCAYHSAFQNANGTYIYANMPYAASTNTCGAGSVAQPNGDDADLTLNVTSHEHLEAITDPFLNAWYDASGNENGDKCAWSFGAPIGGSGSSAWNQAIGSGHYMLQMEWSNAVSGCVQTEPTAPASSVTPSLSGTATVGQILTVSNGTWSPTPTGYQYAWQRCNPTCAAISGAYSSTYTLASADAGATVKALVWAMNGFSHGAAWTASSATVGAGSIPANTVAPSLSGTATVGQTLTIANGTWTNSPTSYQYAWQRCSPTCAAISGAYGSTYTLASADAGATIKALVWALNASGHGAAWTPLTATVGSSSVPTNTVAPSISGTASVGQTLTLANGSWTGSPTSYQYTWFRCTSSCVSINGAWNATYALVTADAGTTLKVLVWAVNGAGHGAAWTAATGTVAAGSVPSNTALPVIAGTTHVGQTLSVTTGTWTNAPTGYQYTWFRCNPTCTAITGAWSSTYALTLADSGATIKVLVWALNAAGHGAATTAATATVS
jgi:hypothetical protein